MPAAVPDSSSMAMVEKTTVAEPYANCAAVGRGMAISVLGAAVGVAVSTGSHFGRLYDGECPHGTGSKRDLTHGAGASGAHGVIPHPVWWDRRALPAAGD
ncbi:hypothetical protein GCM10010353_48920 [Streptomyces chryseus]|nr:hypothetical protein GCM10010353_48920 [Streptomyces chryseus]